MDNFVLEQILWFLSLWFFLGLSFIVVRTFTTLPFPKRFNFIFEILLCLIVLSYMLAFRVNF